MFLIQLSGSINFVFGMSCLHNLNALWLAADEPALDTFESYPKNDVTSKIFDLLEDDSIFSEFVPHPGNDATFNPVMSFTHTSSTAPSFFP